MYNTHYYCNNFYYPKYCGFVTLCSTINVVIIGSVVIIFRSYGIEFNPS